MFKKSLKNSNEENLGVKGPKNNKNNNVGLRMTMPQAAGKKYLLDPIHSWNCGLGSFEEGVCELHGEALDQRGRRSTLHLTVEPEQHPVPGNQVL